MPIRDEFHDEQLLQLNKITPWFADICNFIIASQFPPEASRCIPDFEIKSVGDHYGLTQTARKVLDCRFYWPTIFRDAYQFVSTYERY
ncbi:hypothetical protein CR513_25369, partial [Mucuna pruriens]